MATRYRIYHKNGKWSKHSFKGYFAGWIDDYREAKKCLKELKKRLKGDFEIHSFNSK